MADHNMHTDPKQNQTDRKADEAKGNAPTSSANPEKGAVGDREWNDKTKSGETPTGQKSEQNPTGQTQGQNPTAQAATSETGEPGRARNELDSDKSDKNSR